MKVSISDDQRAAVLNAGIELTDAVQMLIASLQGEHFDVALLGDNELIQLVEIANATYRAGAPIVSDVIYDQVLLSQLEKRIPSHPFLHEIEPEAIAGKVVELPAIMLSMRKAYTEKAILGWIENIKKAAQQLELDPNSVEMRVSPKLDGFAAYDDGRKLYTRGDGRRGTDITRVFERGLKIGAGGTRGMGPGEIVTNKLYFDRFLSETFDSARNVQAAILAEKNIDPLIQKAIDDGAAAFVPFAAVGSWTGRLDELEQRLSEILHEYAESREYETDGVVLETTNQQVKERLGSGRQYHRWQIAYKVNQAGIEVEVIDVEPSTSRQGRVNPTVILVPRWLSGATISRATAHHYKMVKDKGIGPGAKIEIVRSGLVIPKIQSVISEVKPKIPEFCPSCEAALEWRGDHLFCANVDHCPAQAADSLGYFFKTLSNNDGFGPQTIKRLQKNGINKVVEVYRLTKEQLESFGFGEKTASNLVQQLRRSKEESIEDWRLLAAFGIEKLGPGNSEKLLSKWKIEEVFELTKEQIATVPGLGDATAELIFKGLQGSKSDALEIMSLGFNLEISSARATERAGSGFLSGLSLVFTGTMIQSSRTEMERNAMRLGATVSASISKKTSYLIAGGNAGKKKLGDAAAKDVKVLTEAEYLGLLAKRTKA